MQNKYDTLEATMQSSIDTLKNENGQLKQNFDTLKNDNEQLKQNFDTLKNENEQLKQNFRELQEKLNKLAKVKMGDAEGGAEENAKK